MDRYTELAAEKEALDERWDQQSKLMEESHERQLLQITEEYEAKLLVRAPASRRCRLSAACMHVF